MNYPNMGAYNQQLQSIQNQLSGLQNNQFQQQPIQMPQYTSAPAEPEQIKTTAGIEGARAYFQKMPPNSSAVLFDNNSDVFYSGKKDANGMMFPIAIGHFTLETEEEQTTNYVTKKDFEEFKAELKQMMEAKHE